jgi:hypothetical protein
MNANKLLRLGKGLLWAALLVFSVFFLNVFVAGPLGMTPFLDDLQEMLLLFLAVVLFTSGTLALESRANILKANQPPGD